MNDYTITTTISDIEPYAVDMDSMCVSVDYDVADDYQRQLDEIIKTETDIQFE